MKKIFTSLFLGFVLSVNAQTPGTLSFSFTPVSHNGYSGTKNVLAVWIRDNNGGFVKTRLRYVGWGTADHLPTWAVNAGGSAFNAMSGCNIIDAITGATLSNFTTKSITWDGTNTSENIVNDGTYKVCILSTWNHGNSGTTYKEYPFTKGPSSDIQTPADDANFTNISLEWNATVGVDETSLSPIFNIYPNPTSGILNIEYKNITNIKVVDMQGKIVISKNFSNSIDGKEIFDFSSFSKGIYQVVLVNNDKTIVKKIILQ
jgi:hypothetical protein